MNLLIKNIISKIPFKYRKHLEYIVTELNKRHFEVYVIGGSVRDLIMGKTPDEFDLTTSARPEEVKKTFPKVIDTGIKHGTVTILVKNIPYEVTTYRRDLGYTDGRRPDKVEYGTSLEEDMERRDFTMNAIALDLIEEKLIDNHNGIEDIKNKIIRTIGDPIERFREDGLRPIRAIRFMSKLNFRIEEKTYKAIWDSRDITKMVSVERFQDELNKILLSHETYIGLKELHKNDIFSLFIPSEFAMQPNVNALEKINLLAKKPLGLQLSYLLYCLYEERDKDRLELILRNLKYSKQVTKDVLFYNELGNQSYDLGSLVDNRKILSFFLKHIKKEELNDYTKAYFSLLRLYHDESIVSKFEKNVESILAEKEPLTLGDLAINGKDILAKYPKIDKKKIGICLQTCLEYVIEFPGKNTKENLLEVVERIH